MIRIAFAAAMGLLKSAAFKISCLFLLNTLIASGLLCSICQAVVYVILYSRYRTLYRRINYFFFYTVWGQFTFFLEWFTRSSFTLYSDAETLAHYSKESCLVLMNHKYNLDWAYWMKLNNFFRNLGNSRSVAKKPLRLVPVFGWVSFLSEDVYLARDWGTDRTALETQLDNCAEYKDPLSLVLCCEGTRWSPEKHEVSLKFAESRNLPPLKHHLYPRPKGFAFAARHLKDKFPAVYDLQLEKQNESKPCYSTVVSGNPIEIDFYLKRIPMEQVPTDSEEETINWLYRRFQEKDKLVEYHRETGKFPGKPTKMKRSIRTLLNTSFWSVTVGLPLHYFIVMIFLTGNTVAISVAFAGAIVFFIGVYLMIKYTMTGKRSSYGNAKAQNGG